MVARPQLLTYGDLERMREMRNETLELIDGELFVTPSPTPLPQRVSRRLHHLLKRHIIDANVGAYFGAPLDVRLASDTVLQPDLIVLLNDRSHLVTERNVEGPPSLVIEIISPSTRRLDVSVKRDAYARFGVPEYWLIDPEHESVTIFAEPDAGRYRDQTTTNISAISATIPELSVDLKRLFNRGSDD
jgi:Uma2 family endonuclease